MPVHYCPFCGQPITLLEDSTLKIKNVFLKTPETYKPTFSNEIGIQIITVECPECKKIEIHVEPSRKLEVLNSGFPYAKRIYPAYSQGMYLPEYVPDAIKNDYREACAILELSPKASATLSRRCMQGIIRDFWKISKGTLAQEINEIKDKVDPSTWKALNNLRQLGNIGAHMEKDINTIVDIDQDEAKILIKFIEYLIKTWYINRHEQEAMLQDITKINQEKQQLRYSENPPLSPY